MTGLGRKRRALRDMEAAQTYEEWLGAASELDRFARTSAVWQPPTSNLAWQADERSSFYDAVALREDIGRLERLLDAQDPFGLVDLLETSLERHHYDVVNPRLYQQTYTGETKALPQRYLQVAVRAMRYLADEKRSGLPIEVKIERFTQAQHKFGRTALMLSGGGSLGVYHLGVVKALSRRGLLPRTIAGSSMGAIIAAVVCTRTPDELDAIFEHPAALHRLALQLKQPADIVRQKALFQRPQLIEHIKANLGYDYTFGEAYEKTGLALNISVAPTRRRQKPRILNHLTSPDLLISHSAAISCAMPFLFEPGMLMARGPSGEPVPYLPTELWIDGSVGSDIPIRRVGRLHNVNHFIVSQTNAHVYVFASRAERARLAHMGLELASAMVSSQAASVLGTARRFVQHETVRPMLDGLYQLMAQPYMGDINIHPRVDPGMLRKVLANPTQEDLERYILEGERVTWPKVAMVRDQTMVSRTFEEIVTTLEARCLAGD